MKKLLVFLLVFCMLSLVLLASCDSKKSKDDDDDDDSGKTVQTNAPTTSKGATITKEEWAGMLSATNVTVSYPIPSLGAIATYSLYNGSSSFKISGQDQTYYYTTKNGEFFRLTVVGGSVQTIEKNSSAMANLADVCFFNELTADDYESLVYNEETQTYSISKGYTYSFEFCFVDGVISTAVANGTNYTFTNYGSTKVNVPSFKVNSGSSSNSSVDSNGGTTNTGNGSTSDSNGSTGDSDWNDDFEPSKGSTIIYEEWIRMLRADNFYASHAPAEYAYYKVADGAIVSPSSIIAKHNGHVYIFIENASGGWDRSPSVDTFKDVNLNWLFFQGKATDSDFYSLEYDSDNECYNYNSNRLYFRDGYLYKLEAMGQTVSIEKYGEMKNDLSDLSFPEDDSETGDSGYSPDYSLPDNWEDIYPDYSLPDNWEDIYPDYSLPDNWEDIYPDYSLPDNWEDIYPDYSLPDNWEDIYPDSSYPYPDDTESTAPGYDDDEPSPTITYDEWVYNINLKNYVFADSQTGIVYRVTENVYARESQYELTQVYIVDGDYVYVYIMDENGDFQYSDTWDASEADAPTLGELIGYTDPDTYYDLYYDEDEGCYYHEGYRFEFENGLLVEFDYLRYISNHGTTVIEEMPDVNDNDGVRTEITVDEWNEARALSNCIVHLGDTTFYITENAYFTEASDYSVYAVLKDGNVYYFISTPSGDYKLDTVEYGFHASYFSIGSLFLYNMGYDDESVYYNLHYSEDGGYYYTYDGPGGETFKFENGLITSFLSFYTVSDHNQVTLENVPSVDEDMPEIGGEDGVFPLTFDEWEALCQTDNYTIVTDFGLFYISNNVCKTIKDDYLAYAVFEDGVLNIYGVTESGNRYWVETVDTIEFSSFTFGEFVIKNFIGIDYAEAYYLFDYDVDLDAYTYENLSLYFDGITVTSFYYNYTNYYLSDFGCTYVEELPEIESSEESPIVPGDTELELAYDEWVNMLYMKNFTATADGQDMYFDNGKMNTYMEDYGDSYFFENGTGSIYVIINYDGYYYAMHSDYGQVTLGKYILADIVTEDDYYGLTYDSSSDCYLFETNYYGMDIVCSFVFENGVIQQISMSVDGETSYCEISAVGETSVTLPDYTYMD